jgi:hypothetical protein
MIVYGFRRACTMNYVLDANDVGVDTAYALNILSIRQNHECSYIHVELNCYRGYLAWHKIQGCGDESSSRCCDGYDRRCDCVSNRGDGGQVSR